MSGSRVQEGNLHALDLLAGLLDLLLQRVRQVLADLHAELNLHLFPDR